MIEPTTTPTGPATVTMFGVTPRRSRDRAIGSTTCPRTARPVLLKIFAMADTTLSVSSARVIDPRSITAGWLRGVATRTPGGVGSHNSVVTPVKRRCVSHGAEGFGQGGRRRNSAGGDRPRQSSQRGAGGPLGFREDDAGGGAARRHVDDPPGGHGRRRHHGHRQRPGGRTPAAVGRAL